MCVEYAWNVAFNTVRDVVSGIVRAVASGIVWDVASDTVRVVTFVYLAVVFKVGSMVAEMMLQS